MRHINDFLEGEEGNAPTLVEFMIASVVEHFASLSSSVVGLVMIELSFITPYMGTKHPFLQHSSIPEVHRD